MRSRPLSRPRARLEPAVGDDLGANGRGGAPGQERATPPFAVERLLQGTLLTHPRSIG